MLQMGPSKLFIMVMLSILCCWMFCYLVAASEDSAKFATTSSSTNTTSTTRPFVITSGRRYGNDNETITPRTTTIISAQSGDTAFLPCHVNLREEHGVSWVRRKDWHIMAADLKVYSKDERVRMAFTDVPEMSWTLLIKYIKKEDEGVYDCQISTRRGVWSQSVELHVIEPQAVLVGSDDIYIGVGSSFTITCVVTNTLKPPEYVLWLLDSKTLNFGTTSILPSGQRSTSNAGHTVTYEPGPPSLSRLTVHSATSQDSGRYTCQPSSGQPASTQVHVALGNEMAAIQAADAAGSGRGIRIISLLLPISVLFLAARHNYFSFIAFQLRLEYNM